MTGRALVWLCLVVHTSGCLYATVTLWPRTTVVDVVDVPTEIEVDTSPSGGSVRPVGGTEVAVAAPFRYRTTYRVKRTYQRYSKRGFIVGALLDLPLASLVAYRYFSRSSHDWFDLALLFAGTADLSMGLVSNQIMLDQLNTTAQRHSASETLPRRVELEATWPGWQSARVTAELPAQASVIVRRSTTVSFEQALLQWYQATHREPTGEGLYELGEAFRRRAADRADLVEAAGHLRAYLTGSDVTNDRRALVETELADLDRLMDAPEARP